MQDSIYYVSGESLDTIDKLPKLQIFKKKNMLLQASVNR